MGSSFLRDSTDSGTSMPTESLEESIPSLKLTKPSIMELRSLTPVFCGPLEGATNRRDDASLERD
jgi:hypothetical protein